jgi:chorismate dehydratase
MKRAMRLGCIDYLNCYPFYFHMFERRPIDGVEVIRAIPSSLNSMFAAGELDMSPISAGALADLDDNVLLVPHFCLSSEGYVNSVLLRSKLPIEELDNKKVGLTNASRTSVALLKILLHRYFKVNPIYEVTQPNPNLNDLDASLVIGNDAMIEGPEKPSFIYDLGELWLRKTGFPVVFAVFAVRAEAAREFPRGIAAVIESYRFSLHCLEQEEDLVVSKACAQYPDINYDVASYYHLFDYKFNERLRQALRFYLDSGSELGLFSQNVPMRFLEIDEGRAGL